MNIEDITKFRDSLANLSIDQLKEKRDELREKIAKMIMDSEITMQIAIVEAQIQEKVN